MKMFDTECIQQTNLLNRNSILLKGSQEFYCSSFAGVVGGQHCNNKEVT